MVLVGRDRLHFGDAPITNEVIRMSERSETNVKIDRLVMPILIGCEESQVICSAFRRAGY